DSTGYARWLGARTDAPIHVHPVMLSGPTQFGEIYEAALSTIDKVGREAKPKAEFTYHLSPGTPAMAAVWILLAKTARPADLIESPPKKGPQTVPTRSHLRADPLPHLRRPRGKETPRLPRGPPPDAPAFECIIPRGPPIKRVVPKARRLAA